VLAAIQLNDQAFPGAEEIHDVVTHGDLSAKLQMSQPTITQQHPHAALSIRLVLPQRRCADVLAGHGKEIPLSP
jgi:hypothetical protein